MTQSARIRCINKTDRQNPHERIQNVGGVGSDGGKWKISQPQAIQHIEGGTWTFYVEEGGKRVDVIVATHNGNKYIKTRADGAHPDNLLSLPECS